MYDVYEGGDGGCGGRIDEKITSALGFVLKPGDFKGGQTLCVRHVG